MQAYKTETTLTENGTVKLTGLPFQAGERIEVIVLACPQGSETSDRYPLRGKLSHYERPTDPVAEEDWEALK